MARSGIDAENIQDLVDRIAYGGHHAERLGDVGPSRACGRNTSGRQHTDRHDHCEHSRRKKPERLLFSLLIQNRQINEGKQRQIALMDKADCKIEHARPD